MENVLDLKMPGVMELRREELKELNGGGLFFELTIAVIEYSVMELSKDVGVFVEGVKEGWEENKR